MISYSVCNELGEFLRSGSCQEMDFELQAINPGELVILGAYNDNESYVSNTEIAEVSSRPVMPLVASDLDINTNESVTVTGIPEGTLVETPSGSAVIDTGAMVWPGSTVEGEFVFFFTNFPYRREVVNVSVS